MAPKILFVPQNAGNSTIGTELSGQGYEVLRAENGLKFVSHLEVENPDLILMETRPHWANTFNLCSAIRHGRFGSKPVFFLSHSPDEEECKNSYQCGCTQYFRLPQQKRDLFRRIRECAGTP